MVGRTVRWSDGRTVGRSDGRTVGRSVGRSVGRLEISSARIARSPFLLGPRFCELDRSKLSGTVSQDPDPILEGPKLFEILFT